MNAQTTSQIKMFASFNRGIFLPLVGANADPKNVYNVLKDKNARISLDHVQGLMEGRESVFKDFEVVSIVGAKTIAGDDQAQSAPVDKRSPVPMGPQKATLQSGTAQVARGRGREFPPSGQIKPLKRGTVYAQLMEMLVKGATMKELLSATSNTTAGGVNDVLSWQVKQRGYGLSFDQATGKYRLVFPQGHSALAYQD
jgi:hypothetical protein